MKSGEILPMGDGFFELFGLPVKSDDEIGWDSIRIYGKGQTPSRLFYVFP